MKLKNIIFSSLIVSGFGISSAANADVWTVDPAKSSLGFEVQQGDGTLTGEFATWTASIDFDPAAPETAKISAEIAPASAATGNPQFDGTLPNGDWFDVAAFPSATFTATTVSLVEGNTYRADGTLDIKGVSQPVTLDFTLDIDGDTAKAVGKAALNRLDYNLGASVAEGTVGNAVTVVLDLTATR